MDRLQFSAWQYVAEILPAEELPMLAAHEDVGNGLSMTVTARTWEETRFLSVAADYSEWLEPDELAEWEKKLRTAAHSLAAVTDLGPSIGAPGARSG